VEGGRRNALPAELIHLVFHEGDQRRDHEGRAFEQKGGELVADRLSGPGRHDREQVLAFECGAHDGFLALPKGIVAEMAAERGAGVHARIIPQQWPSRAGRLENACHGFFTAVAGPGPAAETLGRRSRSEPAAES
jgi:hypothetical protein